MRLLTTTTILMLSLSAAEARDRPSAARCSTGNDQANYRPKQGPKLHVLGEEPPAAAIRAVYREVDGCPAQVVLREGIGANPDKRQPIVGGGAGNGSAVNRASRLHEH